MKYIIAGIIGIGLLIAAFFAYDPNAVKMYNTSGLVSGKPTKMFVDTFTVSSSSQTLDISPAGFTRILSVSVQPELNTSTASQMPIASIKSYTTTSITVNFIQSNSQTISILGAVAIGLQSLQSFNGTRVHVQVCGW